MGSFFFVKKTGGCRQPGKIDSPLNEKLNSVKWGEFRLGDLFEIEGTKSLDSNAIDFVETGINFIGRTFENNGIQGKILKRNFEPNEPFTITATVIGNYKYVKYQKEPYYCSQNINKLTPKKIICKWTEKIAYFFVANIQSFVSLYNGQQGGYKLETINNHRIQLPITSTGEIDFAFMEKFISELNAYLEVTGLKDYTLTPEEENALKDFEKMEWGEFEIGDLFDFLTSKKRFDANKVKILENGNYPYIVRTSLNNGTKGYLNENEEYLNSGNTISFGQDTATIFYQKEPYFTGDKIKIVKAKDDLFNAKNALYFLTSMNKSFQVYSWGSSSFNVDILSKEKMFLPLQNNSLNYPFMETFISAIQKLVIKDVVLYADKKINATKSITTKP